jgi:hypothetical protein
MLNPNKKSKRFRRRAFQVRRTRVFFFIQFKPNYRIFLGKATHKRNCVCVEQSNRIDSPAIKCALPTVCEKENRGFANRVRFFRVDIFQKRVFVRV